MSKLEKIVEADDWKTIVAPFIVKPRGKPTLALETDIREEYKWKSTAEEAFGGENSFQKEEKQI